MAFQSSDLESAPLSRLGPSSLPGFCPVTINGAYVPAVRSCDSTVNLRFLVLFRVLLLVGMALAYALPAAAQSDGGVLTKQQAVVEDIAEKTDTYAKQLDGDISEDGRLVEIRNELEKLSRALLESGLAFRPRLMEINAPLDQLGPPRAEGEPPEPTAVA